MCFFDYQQEMLKANVENNKVRTLIIRGTEIRKINFESDPWHMANSKNVPWARAVWKLGFEISACYIESLLEPPPPKKVVGYHTTGNNG